MAIARVNQIRVGGTVRVRQQAESGEVTRDYTLVRKGDRIAVDVDGEILEIPEFLGRRDISNSEVM